MGIVEELISGRDGVVRAAKLQAGKGTLEWAVQHLYPRELTCDRENVRSSPHLNPEAPTLGQEGMPHVAAQCRIQDINVDTD